MKRLTDAQIGNGLEQLMRAGGEHAPSLPQFVALCRNAREFARALPALARAVGDAWDAKANLRLLAHVLREGLAHRYFDARETRILVQFKHAWAADCRALATAPAQEDQDLAWRDCMDRAALEIRVPATPGTEQAQRVPLNRAEV